MMLTEFSYWLIDNRKMENGYRKVLKVYSIRIGNKPDIQADEV